MCRKDRLATFAEQIGFTVRETSGVVTVEGVPCLLKSGTTGSCTIEKSFDPVSGKPTKTLGGADHAIRVTLNEAQDGCVYNADKTRIGNYLGGDEQTWSIISVGKGSARNPEKDESARDTIHRYARQIVGAVSAAGNYIPVAHAANPFRIPYTFEDRAGIAPVQDRIRGQSIVIIGLGGTGAYVLDLIAKTPVSRIHLLDPDHVEWHNFMRAPGAPTGEEIASLREKLGLNHTDFLCKVSYFHSKYDSLREGIRRHAVRLDSSSMFTEFLSEHPIDYAFVCIDQVAESDSPRQDEVYSALSEAKVPFIDSGISISVENDAIRGAVTTSAYTAGSLEWQTAIPNARVNDGRLGYNNVQLPEVNALAASLAVMEWRRRTEQYVSESSSFLHKFRLETPRIVYIEAD